MTKSESETRDECNVILLENLNTKGGTLKDPDALTNADTVVTYRENEDDLVMAYMCLLFPDKVPPSELLAIDKVECTLGHNDRKWVYISQLAVSKILQCKGIGTQFYAQFDNSIISSYVDRVYAYVSLNNPASMACHIKAGFAPCGTFETPDFHGVKNYRSILFMRSFSEADD